MRTRSSALVLALPLLLLGSGGCFNDWFRADKTVGGEGGRRFDLKIEADRTDVDATHFLVDRATGDLWRLDARGGDGRWVRLADGPIDAQPLAEEAPEDGDEG